MATSFLSKAGLFRVTLLALTLLFCACNDYFSLYHVQGLCASLEDGSTTDCWMYLSKKKYWITFDSSWEDIVFVGQLSYGKVNRVGERLYLRDSQFGIETVLTKNGRNLRVEKSFPFLDGQLFEHESDLRTKDEIYESDLDMMVDSLTDFSAQMERIVCYKAQNPEEIPLKEGLFRSEKYLLLDYAIEIKENQTYRLSAYTFPISEGTWTREGNVLMLSDPNFSKTFYLLVADNKLIGEVLPLLNEWMQETFLYPSECLTM